MIYFVQAAAGPIKIEIQHAHATGEALTATPSGITITASHRTLLRRIAATNDSGDLRHLVSTLVEAGLVCVRHAVAGAGWTPDNDGAALLLLTDAGRRLLAAHDAQDATVRRERPRLTSKPFPAQRWQPVAETGRDHTRLYVHTVVRCSVQVLDNGQCAPLWLANADGYGLDLGVMLAAVEDVADLLNWLRHEAAVAAQDKP